MPRAEELSIVQACQTIAVTLGLVFEGEGPVPPNVVAHAAREQLGLAEPALGTPLKNVLRPICDQLSIATGWPLAGDPLPPVPAITPLPLLPQAQLPAPAAPVDQSVEVRPAPNPSIPGRGSSLPRVPVLADDSGRVYMGTFRYNFFAPFVRPVFVS
jgi:hypothetical protein